MPQGRRHIAGPKPLPALTGLRGVGAVLVVLYHMIYSMRIPILDEGYMGVDLFFILSGFIMSHVYGDRVNFISRREYLDFLKSRLARVYPLHIFTLLLLLLIVVILPGFSIPYSHARGRFGIGSFVANTLLVQTWGFGYPGSWNGPSWSLSAEWFAYLCLPVILLPIRLIRTRIAALVASILSVVVLYSSLRYLGYRSFDTAIGRAGMLRMLSEFSLGCIIYRLYLMPSRNDIMIATSLFILAVIAAWISPRPDAFLVIVSACAVFLGSQSTGIVAWTLSLRFVVFLGDISFSVYMIHWIVLQIFNWLTGRGLILAGTWLMTDATLFIIIVCLSYLSYRFIEKPARAWGKALGRPTSPATVPVEMS